MGGANLPAQPACRVTAPLTELVEALLPSAAASAWAGAEIAGLRRDMRARLALKGEGHTAQSVIETLNTVAPPGCRLTVDSGAHMFAAMAFYRAEEAFGVLKSNGLSTMGYALPAGVASALQDPTAPVVAVTGDGGLMMCPGGTGNGCRAATADRRLVLNDAGLSLIDIKQQRQQLKSRGVRYPSVDFATAARALGCRGWRLAPDAPLAPLLEEAFRGDTPALIDIHVDGGRYAEQLAGLRG